MCVNITSNLNVDKIFVSAIELSELSLKKSKIAYQSESPKTGDI